MNNNYVKALEDFITILNNTAISALDDEEIYISDGYDYMDSEGNFINHKGLYVTSYDWLGGGKLEDEVISIPSPCTHDDYMRICKEIMNRSFDFTIWESRNCFHTYKLENYINDFAKKLKSEWDIFKNVSLKSIPISIRHSKERNTNGEPDYNIAGTYNPSSNSINIFSANYEHEEEDEIKARHETIHYMLAEANLNYADDSLWFWFFATIYDAHPYKELSSEVKTIFDNMINIYNEVDRETMNNFIAYLIKECRQNERG